MAILTPLETKEIREAALDFGVDVTAARGVLGGSVNTNYLLTDPGGASWFFRLYEEQDATAAEREARLLWRLSEMGVPTPAPLPRVDSESYTGALRGKPIAVFPFVRGTIRCQKSVRPVDAFAVGRMLARIHAAGLELSAAEAGLLIASKSRFGLAELRARLESLSARTLDADVAAAREQLLRLNDSLVATDFRAADVALVHGDVFRDNVLFEEDDLVAVLDFESASRGSAMFDVAVTWLAWCFGDSLDRELSSAFGAGYRSVRVPPREELDDLSRAARLACCRFATTRITDYELRPSGVGIYKDFRRWLRRLESVEGLGPLGLREALGFDTFG